MTLLWKIFQLAKRAFEKHRNLYYKRKRREEMFDPVNYKKHDDIDSYSYLKKNTPEMKKAEEEFILKCKKIMENQKNKESKVTKQAPKSSKK